MAWNNITAADVTDDLTPTELAVLNNIAGATDGVALALQKVVAKVRGQIKAGGNQVDQTSPNSIPDQLAEEVIAITRMKWLNSFPGLKTMKTPERVQAAKDAEALLKEISSNKPDRQRVELPVIVDTSAAPVGGVQVASRSRRRYTGRSLEGI